MPWRTTNTYRFLSRLGHGLRHPRWGFRQFRDFLSRPLEQTMRQENERLQQEINALRKRFEGFELLITNHLLSRAVPVDPDAPLVSIIMPTLNRAHIIGEAIASVIAQRYANWELIIVDDGSRDSTAETIHGFLSDSRIRYVRQTTKGHAAARNHALRLSKGELIAYLDSDNTWYPEFLAVAVKAFTDNRQIKCAYGALVTDIHTGRSIQFEEYRKADIAKDGFIDLNVFVHRRCLFEELGGFDEKMTRLVDWDLVLRYTQSAEPVRLPVFAARYHVKDLQRVSSVEPFWPNKFAVQSKTMKSSLPAASRPLRVLYVLWNFPQLSETYVDAEIHCMQRWGVHVEVWSETLALSSHSVAVPVHGDSLEEAVALVQPDVIHIHWLNTAAQYAGKLAKFGVPITARAHGYELNDDLMRCVIGLKLHRVFCFPHHRHSFGLSLSQMGELNAAFDTTLFKPVRDKDRRMVLRAGAVLPSKDLEFFIRLAKRLPDHHFVFAGVTCVNAIDYMEKLRKMWVDMGSRGEFLMDVPREDIIPMVERAGIYLHTAHSVQNGGTPIGMPISIAESMATGAHIIVRDHPSLVDYVGDAGQAYRDLDHAAEIITKTTAWTDAEWQAAWMRSVDRAYMNFADETVLRPLLETWYDAASGNKNMDLKKQA